jgi:hypothetical protein
VLALCYVKLEKTFSHCHNVLTPAPFDWKSSIPANIKPLNRANILAVVELVLTAAITIPYHYVEPPITLVYSIYDSTEVAIQKIVEANQRIIIINSRGEGGYK